MSAVLSFSGNLGRSISRSMTAALSFIGNVVSTFIPGSHSYTQALSASLGFAGSVTKATTYPLSGALSFVGSTAKGMRRSLAGVLNFNQGTAGTISLVQTTSGNNTSSGSTTVT